jgi:Tfp pilus assembly protein PilN
VRLVPLSKWITLLAHLTALRVADAKNAGKKAAGAASTQPKDTGSAASAAAGSAAGSQTAIHELFAKAQLQVCNRFAAISLQ